jgi:hypothetical protein
MKTISLIFTILMALQSNQPNLKDYDFDRAWTEVEKSINDGLPKSALTKWKKY